MSQSFETGPRASYSTIGHAISDAEEDDAKEEPDEGLPTIYNFFSFLTMLGLSAVNVPLFMAKNFEALGIVDGLWIALTLMVRYGSGSKTRGRLIGAPWYILRYIAIDNAVNARRKRKAAHEAENS